MVSSKKDLIDYCLDRSHHATIEMEVPGEVLMAENGQVVTSLVDNSKFPHGSTTEEKKARVSAMDINYRTRKDIPVGTFAQIEQVWYDNGDHPLFRGSPKNARFELRDGKRQLNWDAFNMGISLVAEVPIQLDGVEEVVITGRYDDPSTRLRSEDGYFFFPTDMVGQEGSLTIRDWRGVSVIDIPTGRTVQTQALEYHVEYTWVENVYTVWPWDGSGTVVLEPWRLWDENVYEVKNADTLVVRPYSWTGVNYPYLMKIRNIRTGELMEIPSTASGEYELDSNSVYRIWFDWEGVYPEVLMKRADYVVLDSNFPTDVDFTHTFKVTATTTDVFIPISGNETRISAWKDGVMLPEVVSSNLYRLSGTALRANFMGQSGYWVWKGDTAEFSVRTLFRTRVEGTFDIYLPELLIFFGDQTQVKMPIEGGEKTVSVYLGKG